MTLPIEKEIAVLAGGTAVVPGTATKPLVRRGYDLNDLTESGFYDFRKGGTTANLHNPTNNGTVLVINRTSNDISQIFFDKGTAEIYFRGFTGGSWSNWVTVGTASTAGHGFVNEDITGDTEFRLEDKWSSWKNKIVLFRLSGGAIGGDPLVQIRLAASGSWDPPSSDKGSHIIFHPLWEGGRVNFLAIKFARHNSDGRISAIPANSSGINATEGVGEPFRLIFDDYYIGSDVFAWHVAPMVQDVANVIHDYDKTVTHINELQGVENQVKHLLLDDAASYALPYWPSYTLTRTANIQDESYDYTTFGTVKVIGKKGEQMLYVQTTFTNGSSFTDNLKSVLRNVDTSGWVRAYVAVDPTIPTNALTVAKLTCAVDLNSGRLEAPLPADVDITISESRTNSNGSKVYRPYHFVGYTTADGATPTNVISNAAANTVAGANKFRLYGDTTDLEAARDLLEDHTDTGGRARMSISIGSTNFDTFHVTDFSVTTLASTTGLNTSLSYADLTLSGVTSRQIPINTRAQHVRLFLQDLAVPEWVTDPDEDIPTSKLPVGSGANNRSDLVATSANITMATNGNITPVPASLTWNIENTKTSDYTSTGGALILPTERLTDAHNGWILQVLDTSDNLLGESFINVGETGGTDMVVEAETGKYVQIEPEIEPVLAQNGIGLSIWSGTGNGSGTRTENFVFKIAVYEWIDSATYVAQRSSSGGSEGTVGGFDILRRQENISATLTGTTTDLGGSNGYNVDEGATHLEVTIDVPSTMTPANITLLYSYAGGTNDFRNIWRSEGENEAATLLTLEPGKTTNFRFSSAFFHGSGAARQLRLRASAETAMAGQITITLEHEKDVNSAAIEARTMLSTAVSAPLQNMAANLAGAAWTEISMETPVEWDHITHLTIAGRIYAEGTVDSEDSDFALSIPKNEMDWVGDNGGQTLPNATKIKGWYGKGWSANGHSEAQNTWSRNMSAAFVQTYGLGSGVPSRIIALKRDGVYLSDILVSSFAQPCIITYVGCMRRI